jgi:5-hydroxyisourate hydrolase
VNAGGPENGVEARVSRFLRARRRLGYNRPGNDIGRPEVGRLTTHVLDTARGRPAAGLRIDLHRLRQGGGREALASHLTNADGRIDGPLLEGGSMLAGEYELVFHAGAYQAASGLAGEPFLGEVPVRFTIADPAAHYHVPLILSPYGYATYRGS